MVSRRHAVTEFDLLLPDWRQYLAGRGITHPTRAQAAAIPPIHAGEHTLLLAPTGMGKTESAILPLFDNLLRWKQVAPHAQWKGKIKLLYVTPLRALNRDLMARLHEWGKAIGLDVRVRHGDTTQGERDRQSRHPPDVLITTPETLQLLFLGRRLVQGLAGVRAVVLDEVHELASDERGAQLAVALERLVGHAGEFQRVGLSATVGDPADVSAYLGGVGRDVRVVKVPVSKQVVSPKPTTRDRRTAEKIMARPEAAAYLNACLDRIREQKQTLLFVNTRETAEVLAARIRILRESGAEDLPEIAVHHGSLARDVRIAAEQAFKSGRARGLICTSSMELGIDIGDADLVLQMTSPRQVTRLVQRVGRAGHRHDLVSNGVVVAQDPDDVAEAAVIVRETLAERMERLPGPRKPLDVLANQVAAMALEKRKLGDLECYQVVRRAHPFRDLTLDEFMAVVRQLHELWVVYHEAGVIGSKKRTRDYFYENISMIPDEQTYRVINLVTRRGVATLNEGFVASFAEPGATFIVQGQPWRIAEISQEELEIRVEPIKDPMGAIPSWVGEEIPVPWAVAQGVGALRRQVREIVQSAGEEAAARWVAQEHRAEMDAAWSLVEYVEEQGQHALPTDRVVTLDNGAGVVVMNACFGTQVNETLGRILASLLTARLGSSVGLDVDPYRIVLTMPARVPTSMVKEVLLAIEPEHVPTILGLVLQGSTYLKYRLFHTARKFGALARQVDYQRVNVGRMLDVFKGTPLHQEALREVFEDKLDIPRTQEVLRALRGGEIAIVEQGLSPIAAAGLDRKIELISPARADKTLLAAIEERLKDERIVLGCLNCRQWQVETRVKRAAHSRKCPKCDGILLGVTRPWNEAARRVLRASRGATLDEEGRKEMAKLATSANLLADHGERALLALAARGVGPETAGRILAKQAEGHDAFLRAVLEAEITYARNRQFWD
jgi:ATP-dependent Lhr-like helicase